jgi:hypothetical protein
LRFWLASGSPENCLIALKEKKWGSSRRLEFLWQKVALGDVLAIYASKPISRVIGFGKVKEKMAEETALWPDEQEAEKALYPLRLAFATEKVLEPDAWQSEGVFVGDLKVAPRQSLNPVVDRGVIASLLERAATQWTVNLDHLVPPQVSGEVEKRRKKEAETAPSLHTKIRDMLIEIGEMENKVPLKQYPMDDHLLDVVWKRIETGNPACVFEIQVGGDIYHALVKLKHAFDLWNSDLFLVLTEKDLPMAKQLVGGAFHEIKDRIRLTLTADIERLHRLHRQITRVRKDVGLR